MIKAEKILLKGDGIYEAQGNITINNFIRTTSINLKIDTKKLRVEGEGKIILSEVRFIGDLTLFGGKFVLGADPPEFLFSSTVPASFQIGKLGVEISKLRLSSDGVGGTFSVIIPNIRVPDGTSKIKIEDLMISRTTGIESISLELENVSLIDGFVLRTLRLAYDRESDSWSAQGQLEIPPPKDGILDQIGIGVDNLNKPIMAAVFLQRVALEADGLAPGPPPVKLTGSVGLTGGPKIHDLVA
ncbi:MAG: hypothetical protein ACK4HB_02175 [Candidatus Bipolaricaulia bacterium]